MGAPSQDERFERLLRAIVERHAIAIRLHATARVAEEALARAVRNGDSVRHAVRAGAGAGRPDASDLELLAGLVATLDAALAGAGREPAAAALRAAALAGDGAGTARLAGEVFVDVATPPDLPSFVYRALRARRRAGRGEELVAPEDLAVEIETLSRAGLRPATDGPTGLPEPVTLAASFAACGSEIALRRATGDLRDLLLEDRTSGDLLSYGPLAGPFEVAVASAAEDEWWAASPLGFRAYRERLGRALAPRGLACITLDEAT